MVVESVLHHRGPEVNGKRGIGNAGCTLLFHRVGLERKERAVVGNTFVVFLLLLRMGETSLCLEAEGG